MSVRDSCLEDMQASGRKTTGWPSGIFSQGVPDADRTAYRLVVRWWRFRSLNDSDNLIPADAASPFENQISLPFFLGVIDDLNRGAALYAEYILQDLVFGPSGNGAPQNLCFDGWRSIAHGYAVAGRYAAEVYAAIFSSPSRLSDLPTSPA